jgi:hypothetical protein
MCTARLVLRERRQGQGSPKHACIQSYHQRSSEPTTSILCVHNVPAERERERERERVKIAVLMSVVLPISKTRLWKYHLCKIQYCRILNTCVQTNTIHMQVLRCMLKARMLGMIPMRHMGVVATRHDATFGCVISRCAARTARTLQWTERV